MNTVLSISIFWDILIEEIVIIYITITIYISMFTIFEVFIIMFGVSEPK